MAIESGLGARLLVDEFNVSGSTASIGGVRMTMAQIDRTTIDLSAMARLNGKRSGGFDVTSLFDDAAGGSHPVLSTMPTTDRQVSYLHDADRGAAAFACLAKQTLFVPNRTTEGALEIGTSVEANATGVEGGRSLTAGVENSTGAENLTGVDELGAAGSTNFGLQAYLHVISFTGTSVTVTIQDSDDDGSGDAYAAVTGAAFTAASAVGTERIATGRTENVKRWLRLNLAGTYSDVDLAVVVVRNHVSTPF